MLTAMAAARHNDAPTVTRCLRAFAERLTDLTTLLQRMHESCDPTVFYHRIRPFLAGSKNMGEAGLPHGVVYEDGSGSEIYQQYSGGSNAQSSLIQFFDVALGIEHRPTGKQQDSSPSAAREPSQRHNFIREMRQYMPGPHARFLNDVSLVSNIREFVHDNQQDSQLSLAYDACLSMLSSFRDKHIAIVTRYIITPSREVRARSRSRSPEVTRQRLNLAVASRKESNRGDQKGTGGTALIPFLKQARDETGEPAVEDWARRFMKRQIRAEGQGDFFMGKGDDGLSLQSEDVEVKGLAGSWTMDDEVGGICQY
jgi:indoleamine 2,3-dioxygenase